MNCESLFKIFQFPKQISISHPFPCFSACHCCFPHCPGSRRSFKATPHHSSQWPGLSHSDSNRDGQGVGSPSLPGPHEQVQEGQSFPPIAHHCHCHCSQQSPAPTAWLEGEEREREGEGTKACRSSCGRVQSKRGIDPPTAPTMDSPLPLGSNRNRHVLKKDHVYTNHPRLVFFSSSSMTEKAPCPGFEYKVEGGGWWQVAAVALISALSLPPHLSPQPSASAPSLTSYSKMWVWLWLHSFLGPRAQRNYVLSLVSQQQWQPQPPGCCCIPGHGPHFHVLHAWEGMGLELHLIIMVGGRARGCAKQ